MGVYVSFNPKTSNTYAGSQNLTIAETINPPGGIGVPVPDVSKLSWNDDVTADLIAGALPIQVGSTSFLSYGGAAGTTTYLFTRWIALNMNRFTAAGNSATFASALNVSAQFSDSIGGNGCNYFSAGRFTVNTSGAGVGAITEASAIVIETPSYVGGTVVASKVGLRIRDQGASNYSIKTGTGIASFGDVVVGAKFTSPSSGGYSDARFYANEIITAHAHYAFLDDSTINYPSYINPQAHASFTDNTTAIGTFGSDHHNSFQSYPHYSNTGTLLNMAGFFMTADVTAGTVTNCAGLSVNNPTGAGIITNLFGIHLKNLTRGVNNWSIFSESDVAPAYFGEAGIKFGNAVTPQAYIKYNANDGSFDLKSRVGYPVRVYSETLAIGSNANAAFDASISNEPNTGYMIAKPRATFPLWLQSKKLRIGGFSGAVWDDAFAAQIENSSLTGDLEITPRTGFSLSVLAPIITPTYLVTALPAGSIGMRAFVSDALAPAFGVAVVGGGAVGVPVYHDGTSWKVG